jgi:PIN domain nuclease of toxin-antitoxin system
VRLLLDTHILIWTVLGSKRLAEFPWLERYELQFLAEIGRISLRSPEFMDELMREQRFRVDDAPLVAMVRHALRLDWTRDPFDRLLAAHSMARRVPLCTADRRVLAHHRLLPLELRR